MKKAQKLLTKVEEIIKKGGEPANWLHDQLQVILFDDREGTD